MGYNSTTKIIGYPVNTSDVSTALGVVSHRVNSLCTSDKINAYARFKPIQVAVGGSYADSPAGISDSNLNEVNFGLSIPGLVFNSANSSASSFFAQMMNDSIFNWTYTPRTTYMRLGDFVSKASTGRGYFKEAMPPLVCVVDGNGWAINGINEAADPNARIPFYALFKTKNTNINQRAIDNSIGISTSQIYEGDANRNYKIDSCIGADELKDATRTALFQSNESSYFGLALFTYTTSQNVKWANNFVGAYICGSPIGPNITYPTNGYFDPFCLYMNGRSYNYNDTPGVSNPVTIPSGKFFAVPFLRTGSNTYHPLARTPLVDPDYGLEGGSIPQYATKFVLANGMTDCYLSAFRMGTTQGFPATMPSSNAVTIGNVQDAYLYIYISNYTPWTHRTTNGTTTGTTGTIDNWSVDVTIEGTINAATGGGTVNRTLTLTSQDRSAVADAHEGGFIIAPGEVNAKAIAFKIPMIWSVNGVNQAQSISSTNTHLMVTPTLKYNSGVIGMPSAATSVTVYYG